MTTYTESVHRRIVVTEDLGIEVHTTTKVWAIEGETRQEIGSRVTSAEFARGDDVSAESPEVAAVAGAVWAPQDVATRTTALLETMREQNAKVAAEQQRAAEEIEQRRQEAETAMQGIARSREALQAAHAELDAEQKTLSARGERITADRARLFGQGAAVRKERAAASE